MPYYCISIDGSQARSDENVVHTEDCHALPPMGKHVGIGKFANARQAVRYTHRHGYPHAIGCSECSPEASCLLDRIKSRQVAR